MRKVRVAGLRPVSIVGILIIIILLSSFASQVSQLTTQYGGDTQQKAMTFAASTTAMMANSNNNNSNSTSIYTNTIHHVNTDKDSQNNNNNNNRMIDRSPTTTTTTSISNSNNLVGLTKSYNFTDRPEQNGTWSPTNTSTDHQQQQQQEVLQKQQEPTDKSPFSSRLNTVDPPPAILSINMSTIIARENYSSSSSSFCTVGLNTIPAEFSNYSNHINSTIDGLFYFSEPPLMRQTSIMDPFYISCVIQHVGNWIHFAHTAQQLYRCWSLWQVFPNHQPVLIATAQDPNRKPYVYGLYSTLEQMGVQVREWDNLTATNATILSTDTSRTGLSRTQVGLFSDQFRGYKALSVQHAVDFQNKFLSTLGIDDQGHCHASPRIGILNRRKTRRILNEQEIVQAISDMYNHGNSSSNSGGGPDSAAVTTIKVFENEGNPFSEQVQAFSDVDILLSPHGAALTSIIFLPRCAGVVEINPMGFENPEFFGSLAAISGHSHAILYAGGLDKKKEVKYGVMGRVRRKESRSRNICVNVTLVLDAVTRMEQQWRDCCTNSRSRKESLE